MKSKLIRKDFAGLCQHYLVISKDEMRQYIAGHSELGFFSTNPYIIGVELNLVH